MEFYVIPPKKNNELMHSGDRYFCLAQLYLSDKNYRNFFNGLPEDAWVTLDNGAGDHDIVTEDKLFEVMKDLMPNEVIPPDVIFNAADTMINAMSFHNRMILEGLEKDIEIFFCPQGKTQSIWLDCYRWALNTDWIKTIGLSKIGVPYAFLRTTGDVGIMEGRHNCFNYLKVHKLFGKPLHFLGMGDPREFMYYKQFDEFKYVRSSDSCNTIWSAMNKLDWRQGQYKRIPTPKDYFDREVEKHPIPQVLVEENLKFLKESVA